MKQVRCWVYMHIHQHYRLHWGTLHNSPTSSKKEWNGPFSSFWYLIQNSTSTGFRSWKLSSQDIYWHKYFRATFNFFSKIQQISLKTVFSRSPWLTTGSKNAFWPPIHSTQGIENTQPCENFPFLAPKRSF